MMNRPAPTHAPRVPFALLLVALLVGGLAVLLVLNTASAANELRRHDLGAEDAGVAARVEHLRNAVAASKAPGNLARVAGELGMVPAGNPAFLELSADGKVSVLGSPAPASAPPVAPASTPHPHHTAAHGTAKATAKSTAKSPVKPTATATSAAKSPVTSPVKPTATGPAPTPTTTLPGGTR